MQPIRRPFLKKLLIVFVTLLVLIAAGLAVYVASIDWNQHKDKIAQQFSELTGKNIVFEGPVSFRILPSPYLSATNVKIYNPGAVKDVPLVEIKKLVANLSLIPLLRSPPDQAYLHSPHKQLSFQTHFPLFSSDTLCSGSVRLPVNGYQPQSSRQTLHFCPSRYTEYNPTCHTVD